MNSAPKLTDGVILKSIPGTSRFEVMQTCVFESNYLGRAIPVHLGTETDLTTVPWYLRWIISRSGDTKDAAVLHDSMLITGLDSRKTCAKVMHEAMIATNVNPIKARLVYAAIRFNDQFVHPVKKLIKSVF